MLQQQQEAHTLVTGGRVFPAEEQKVQMLCPREVPGALFQLLIISTVKKFIYIKSFFEHLSKTRTSHFPTPYSCWSYLTVKTACFNFFSLNHKLLECRGFEFFIALSPGLTKSKYFKNCILKVEDSSGNFPPGR